MEFGEFYRGKKVLPLGGVRRHYREPEQPSTCVVKGRRVWIRVTDYHPELNCLCLLEDGRTVHRLEMEDVR